MPGPAPKDPAKRLRRNKETIEPTLIRFERAEQPPLPDDDGMEWPQRTVEWWAMWRDAPQAENFLASDWDFLLDTALLHREVWGMNDLTLLPELRGRMAKFGATPEDRARLRMRFKDSTDPSEGTEPETTTSDRRRASSARERRNSVVDDGSGNVGTAAIVQLHPTG